MRKQALKSYKNYESLETYPYLVRQKYAPDWYGTSYKGALSHIVRGLTNLRDQFAPLDSGTAARCEEAIARVRALPQRGGKIRMVLDGHTGVTYDVELIKREQT